MEETNKISEQTLRAIKDLICDPYVVRDSLSAMFEMRYFRICREDLSFGDLCDGNLTEEEGRKILDHLEKYYANSNRRAKIEAHIKGAVSKLIKESGGVF
jgi:hypothetical protein